MAADVIVTLNNDLSEKKALQDQRIILYSNTLTQAKIELLEAIEAQKKANKKVFDLRRVVIGLSGILGETVDPIYDFPKITPAHYSKLRK